MKKTHGLTLLASCLALSACALPYRLPPEYGGAQDWQQEGRYRSSQQPQMQDSSPPPMAGDEKALYGWDGGVVDSRPQGRVVQDDHTRGVEASPTGRMHIIELYQQVLDERDQLADEVETLNTALRKTEEQLMGRRGDVGDLNSQIESMKMEMERLLTQNQELAARLTTAQIRRLEAEKLLLERRINDRKNNAKNADQNGAASNANRKGE